MKNKNDLGERLLKFAADLKMREYLVRESLELKLILASIINKL